MSRAAELLKELRSKGVELTLERGRLCVHRPHPSPPGILRQLEEHHHELLELLASEPPPPKPELDSRYTEAEFLSGDRIQVRLDKGEWMLWLWNRSGWRRALGFAEPTLADARRAVEEWYGEPRDGWHEPRERQYKRRL